jgi:AAA domain
MLHAGRKVGHLEAEHVNVAILAGENPEDLKARMIGMARAFNLNPEQLPYVLPATFPMTDEAAETLKRDIEALGVPIGLIIGDTASSFFPGDDENSNVQNGQYARTLRTLTTCDGTLPSSLSAIR